MFIFEVFRNQRPAFLLYRLWRKDFLNVPIIPSVVVGMELSMVSVILGEVMFCVVPKSAAVVSSSGTGVVAVMLSVSSVVISSAVIVNAIQINMIINIINNSVNNHSSKKSMSVVTENQKLYRILYFPF